MAFLTSGYVDLAVGTSTRVALSPTTSAFVIHEGMARAAVQASAQVAGYSLGNTSTNDMVRLLTLSQWFHFAGGFRRGIDPPPVVREYFDKLTELREGKWPLPGLTPSTEDGIGGVQSSSTNESDAEARVQYFSRTKLTSW
jgi:hypothetical protein